MPQIVAYIRVSTSQQGKSGLGIEAQRAGRGTAWYSYRFQRPTR